MLPLTSNLFMFTGSTPTGPVKRLKLVSNSNIGESVKLGSKPVKRLDDARKLANPEGRIPIEPDSMLFPTFTVFKPAGNRGRGPEKKLPFSRILFKNGAVRLKFGRGPDMKLISQSKFLRSLAAAGDGNSGNKPVNEFAEK